MHKNARRTPVGRERVVRQVEIGQTSEAVSEAAGVCPRLWLSAIVASCRDLRQCRQGWGASVTLVDGGVNLDESVIPEIVL
jgi:hypothetical protein